MISGFRALWGNEGTLGNHEALSRWEEIDTRVGNARETQGGVGRRLPRRRPLSGGRVSDAGGTASPADPCSRVAGAPPSRLEELPLLARWVGLGLCKSAGPPGAPRRKQGPVNSEHNQSERPGPRMASASSGDSCDLGCSRAPRDPNVGGACLSPPGLPGFLTGGRLGREALRPGVNCRGPRSALFTQRGCVPASSAKQRWTGVGLRALEGHDVLGQARLLALKGASGEKAGGDLLGQARRTVVRKNALLGFLFIV